jgi:type VI secretion system protein ImpJ
MTASKVARIKWYVGQTLQPEHFMLQEEALLAEARLSDRVRGLPAHGIARLAWNTQLLAQGELVIASMTVVLLGGALIDVPGNAAVQPLDLRSETSNCVSVYLHLLGQTQDAKGQPLYEDDPRGVERVFQSLRLATEPSVAGATASLRLLDLQRNVGGGWEVSQRYSPPLLQVGTSPFFAGLREELVTLLVNFRREVVLHLSDAYISRDQAAAVRRVVAQSQQFVCLLTDIDQQVYPHPYLLFSALRTLYFELCCFFEAEPESELPAYRHDDPAASFDGLVELLKSRLGHVRSRMRYCSFERVAGSFLVSPIPKELVDASEIYFLVQRPDIKRKVPTDSIKLASPKRLPPVHRLALRGVAFEALSQLPFPHSFGPEIDFYRIDLNEEWSQVLNESAIGFYAQPEHEKVKFSLFWRT